MQSPSRLLRTLAGGAVAATALSCTAALRPSAVPPSPQGSAAFERKPIRSAALVVSVDTAARAARAAEQVITDAGGFVERSNVTTDGEASLQCRVPAAHLGPVMDGVAGLGHEERRSISGADVTAQYADIEARLRTSMALRDRLLQLLGRADAVGDILTVERELSRVQAEIETMQARLDLWKSQVELSELSVTMYRKHKLGPLSSAGYGLWRGLSKLF